MDPRPPLADDDGAGVDFLTSERLHPEPLGLGVAPILGRAAALLVCHRAIERTRGLATPRPLPPLRPALLLSPGGRSSWQGPWPGAWRRAFSPPMLTSEISRRVIS